MKNRKKTVEPTLYVEYRQPTEEEEQLFQSFMVRRKKKLLPIKPAAQPATDNKALVESF